ARGVGVRGRGGHLASIPNAQVTGQLLRPGLNRPARQVELQLTTRGANMVTWLPQSQTKSVLSWTFAAICPSRPSAERSAWLAACHSRRSLTSWGAPATPSRNGRPEAARHP